ncbi:MAG: type IX secretion system membrane protein PorP/SprF [Cytophagales bacterium]|nr:type IX secretion system membrane protein PorP/SprF [Cytophagales bacterium]
MRHYLLFIFLIIPSWLWAQYESKYTQYTLNQLLINPAVSGSHRSIVNTLAYRYQWANSGVGLHQQSATFHLPFNQRRMGLGGIVINEQTKSQNTLQGSFNFSYKINAFKGLLAFGIETGFIQRNTELNRLLIKDSDDPLAEGKNRIEGDFSTGLFYQRKGLYIGLSAKHIAWNSLHNLYFLHLIYQYKYSSNLEIIPSFLVKHNEGWKSTNVDINCHFKIHKQYWLGLSYQSSEELSFQTGIVLHEINKKITLPILIGYSFDYGFSSLYPYNAGSHEMVVQFYIRPRPTASLILNKKRHVSPLFF